MDTYTADLPRVFGALSDPTRLAVVERLAHGPASVGELAAPFEMAAPSFLKHLRVLEGAGLVSSTKQGRVRRVTLAPEALDWVETWLMAHHRRCERQLDDLGNFLEGDGAE